MKDYGFSRNSGIVFQVSAIFLLSLLLGCRPMPAKDTVRDLVLRDFEARHYAVTELLISGIRPSSGERRYMTTETFIVDIPLITLRATEDMGVIKKGRQLRFRDARLSIREDLYQKGKWMITDIKGISVP